MRKEARLTLFTAIPQNRASVTIPYTLNQLQFNQIQDPNQQFRVLFFAAQVDAASFSNLGLDVAFPQQCEIKIGSEVVQWNTRGLKNKPGTTRPADITKYTIYLSNNLTFTYALTAKVCEGLSKGAQLLMVCLGFSEVCTVGEVSKGFRRSAIGTKVTRTYRCFYQGVCDIREYAYFPFCSFTF